MKRYRFVNAVYADVPTVEKDGDGKEAPSVGTRKFVPGDEITERDILPGCLASLLYTGAVVELPTKKEKEGAR